MVNQLTPFWEGDPYLKPYVSCLERRCLKARETEERLTGGEMSLSEFASGYRYFGLHCDGPEWVFREWAPNAEAIYLIGDMNGWEEKREFLLHPCGKNGEWEIQIPENVLKHGDLYRLRIHWPGGSGDRLPVYAARVVQDPETLIFNAQVWEPEQRYRWRFPSFKPPQEGPLIYEAHVGMAQEDARIGTYREFTDNILPMIVETGYNVIQLMGVQEHPYYASFGYHVSNFFAPSSRFGTPEDLKELVDTAHGLGLTVTIDLIHSHAVNNEVEGLSRFDGTYYQYFHEGERGIHRAWDSRCFDYGKPQVLHFLLSNCRYWLEEFHFDGYRFDGITSMLYTHHGLEKAFTSYDDYFNESVDEDALIYLTLANKVIHEVCAGAVTIAEDISGMPGLAVPLAEGGNGFDYRFAMGVPDYWIKLIKEIPDEAWPMGKLWYELNNRRLDEKTISYAESHDQALVGDQTILFRLIGDKMYHHMRVDDKDIVVDRGIALHKMIRLITLATAGNGYLNFMGNEFGHPEWIDFPREGNNWSYHYARRQWHLKNDPNLRYHFLSDFDHDMIEIVKKYSVLNGERPELLYEHNEDKVIAFLRAGLLFVFNFHPTISHTDYKLGTPKGNYQVILDSDAKCYGGVGRLQPSEQHLTLSQSNGVRRSSYLSLYLPTRTALVLRPTRETETVSGLRAL